MALGRYRKRADTEDHPQHDQEIQLTRRKLRRRIGGSLVPVKNPASAGNAKPKKIVVVHAGGSRALSRAAFDMRSTVGKAYRARVDELTAHLGGPDMVTVPQRIFVEHAARLGVLALLALEEINRSGAFSGGDARPALDVYRRLAADEREVLRTLGLERKVKQVPDLDAYLQSKGEKGTHHD